MKNHTHTRAHKRSACTDTATPPKVVDYKLLDTGSERRTVDPVPALTRINATTLALFTLAYDAVTVGGATCARGDTVAAAVELTATTVAVTRAQCHTLGYTSTSFQPAALDRPFDGKLLAVMPYNGFGTEYCGTTLFVLPFPHLTRSNGSSNNVLFSTGTRPGRATAALRRAWRWCRWTLRRSRACRPRR